MRIYLDTSVISALFDHRNPERQILTKEFFSFGQLHELFISDLTVLEIEKTPDPELRERMMAFVEDHAFNTLEVNQHVHELAMEYIKYEAVPSSHLEDAYHMAVATLNDMDYLVSWNFRHIVRFDKINQFNAVALQFGYKPIQIYSPREVIVGGEERED